ncbi:Protein SCAI [Dillenia turbinata]|uniref:Protein SCAI n=1 Tax=Dillenia turbinata TaxID=194707 RepID=A0AAN8Z3X8_9MAGN
MNGTLDETAATFRALVESSDRKFARVRDIPVYLRGNHHYFHKVFKAYLRLWKFQQENRAKLVDSGLQRWEIGEIASRIGQLYFNQYMRTSEVRFLLESYIFYEAILNRGYFEGAKGLKKDLGLRFKELRFLARFLLVSLLLNRSDTLRTLMERFRTLVDDNKAKFPKTNFKEWKQVVQEISRFVMVDMVSTNIGKPLRYCAMFDSHPDSAQCVARFHSKKVLKLKDALLTSYHRNEVKFAELTLDTFRMLQCLEWEPSGSFYQKRPVESHENGAVTDYSGTSGLIDINLAADLTDPTLPSNPRKAVLYRPSATHLIAVLATLCEELPPESVMLIYLSASGKAGYTNDSQVESLGGSKKPSKSKIASQSPHEQNHHVYDAHVNHKGSSIDLCENYLWLGPKGNGGSNNLYPGDIIPFTRRPLFLVIDSDNSHAFKAGLSKLVLHGAEMGETTALLLSPLRSAVKNSCDVDAMNNGSQFTFFLTAPLQAFCQLVGFVFTDSNMDTYNEADCIVSSAFAEWEVILCSSSSVDLVWSQVLSDAFLRRLILRFIFCRAVLSFFCPLEDSDEYIPVCLPHLPNSVAPNSEAVKSNIIQLAEHLGVVDIFHFSNS